MRSITETIRISETGQLRDTLPPLPDYSKSGDDVATDDLLADLEVDSHLIVYNDPDPDDDIDRVDPDIDPDGDLSQ